MTPVGVSIHALPRSRFARRLPTANHAALPARAAIATAP